jgi:hypothetical protein
MILETSTVQYIANAVRIAKLFDIEQIVVEPTFISGISEDKTAAIYTVVDNYIGCNTIGLGRISVLQSRLALIESDNTTVDCVFDMEQSDASDLVIKTPKLTVNYRCSKVRPNTYPRLLAVDELYKIIIPEDLYTVLSRAKTSMKTLVIVLICNNGEMSYKLTDETNDQLVYSDGNAVSVLDENDTDINFVIRSPLKYFLLAIRHSQDNCLYVTEKDMLKCVISDIGVYIPKNKQKLDD